MTDMLTQSPTSAEALTTPEITTSKTLTIEERVRDINEHAGFIRNVTSLINGDAARLQHKAFRTQLDIRTVQLAQLAPTDLLCQLSDLGFAWRDIARMVGVSVPALRRWRSGELPSGEHRRGIAQLFGFAKMIRDDHMVFEPASWMEVPIIADAPVTPIDLYAAGQLDVVYELAAQHCTPEAALDKAEPGWREKYRSDWEVETAEDGERYIRAKLAN